VGTPSAILILDTSVLVNFLAVDRAALLHALSCPVLVTEHVVAEVVLDYPEQHARLKAALEAGFLKEIQVTDLAELQLFADLVSRNTSKRKRLGAGECSAIAVAVHRGYGLGIEDRQAIKLVKTIYPAVQIIQTQDLLVELIKSTALTVPQADQIKQSLSADHRFEMKGFASFADLMTLPDTPP